MNNDWTHIKEQDLRKINFNARNLNGYGAAHHIVSENIDSRVINSMLKVLPDIHMTDKQGHSLLDHALAANNPVSTKILERLGIKKTIDMSKVTKLPNLKTARQRLEERRVHEREYSLSR